eukprot:4186566-Amphidinium_carterae.1
MIFSTALILDPSKTSKSMASVDSEKEFNTQFRSHVGSSCQVVSELLGESRNMRVAQCLALCCIYAEFAGLALAARPKSDDITLGVEEFHDAKRVKRTKPKQNIVPINLAEMASN